MSKFRLAVLALVLLALVLTPALNAGAQAPYYYCSQSYSTGGNGTWRSPWGCSTEAQIQSWWNVICRAGGGTLYIIGVGQYWMDWVQPLNAQGVCAPATRQGPYPGYPPNTGVDLPAPVIYGGIAAAGALLLAAGMLIRRKRTA